MKNILKKFYRKLNNNYQAEYLNRQELSYLNKCIKILDLGCGEGSFISLDKNRITGIDSNRQSVVLAKKKGFNVVYGDVTKLPFKRSSYDGVHCAHVIEHLYPHEAHKLLKEVGRVLKKGGIFVLTTPVMWRGFYNDFTHIRPYYAQSIIRYLSGEGGESKSFESLNLRFVKEKLIWRYQPVYFLPGRVGKLIGNYLFTKNIHSFEKDAYCLVMKKL